MENKPYITFQGTEKRKIKGEQTPFTTNSMVNLRRLDKQPIRFTLLLNKR